MTQTEFFCQDNIECLKTLSKELVGKVDLIYTDPPFATGRTFFHKTKVSKEETYRDDADLLKYLSRMRSCFEYLHSLLNNCGSLFVHTDCYTGPYLKILLDEIFGMDNFQNEIAWYYYNKLPSSKAKKLPKAFDQILYYVKDRNQNYTYHVLKEPREKPIKKLKYRNIGGQIRNIIGDDGKAVTYLSDERMIDNVWRIRCLQPASPEWTGFETQKPVDLAERILQLASNPGDLVLDCFAGSGTVAVACKKLNRNSISIDINQASIDLAKKRVAEIPDEESIIHGA